MIGPAMRNLETEQLGSRPRDGKGATPKVEKGIGKKAGVAEAQARSGKSSGGGGVTQVGKVQIVGSHRQPSPFKCFSLSGDTGGKEHFFLTLK